MKSLHQITLSAVVTVVALGALMITLPGCEKPPGPAEQAGQKIDQATEKVGEQVEKAGDAIQDAAKGEKQ